MNSIQFPDSQIWFVRAEQNNVMAYHFLEEGLVHMGWGIGPVRPDESQNDILGRLRAHFPQQAPGTLSKWAREIREFNQDIELGDAVATYDPRSRTYHIGTVQSRLVTPEPWLLREWGNDHVHRVEWRYRVGRDTLPQGFARKNLDRRSTLHRLSPEASAELRQHCLG